MMNKLSLHPVHDMVLLSTVLRPYPIILCADLYDGKWLTFRAGKRWNVQGGAEAVISTGSTLCIWDVASFPPVCRKIFIVIFPLPVWQSWRWRPVAHGDEVPELRGLGHRGAHSGAAGQEEHFLRVVVQQVVQHSGALAGVALAATKKKRKILVKQCLKCLIKKYEYMYAETALLSTYNIVLLRESGHWRIIFFTQGAFKISQGRRGYLSDQMGRETFGQPTWICYTTPGPIWGHLHM